MKMRRNVTLKKITMRSVCLGVNRELYEGVAAPILMHGAGTCGVNHGRCHGSDGSKECVRMDQNRHHQKLKR